MRFVTTTRHRIERRAAAAIYSVVNIIIAYGRRTDRPREESPSSGQSRPITGNEVRSTRKTERVSRVRMCVCVCTCACVCVYVCVCARAQVTWLESGSSDCRKSGNTVHTRTHNGCIVSGRRAAAVVLLQGYIPELLMPPRRRRTRRARSLSTGMPHLARARVQSVGPIRKTSVVHLGAPLPLPPHTKTHTHM